MKRLLHKKAVVTGASDGSRIGEPDDLAEIAVYLASDEAKWVTGSIIHVDGGLTIN